MCCQSCLVAAYKKCLISSRIVNGTQCADLVSCVLLSFFALFLLCLSEICIRYKNSHYRSSHSNIPVELGASCMPAAASWFRCSCGDRCLWWLSLAAEDSCLPASPPRTDTLWCLAEGPVAFAALQWLLGIQT